MDLDRLLYNIIVYGTLSAFFVWVYIRRIRREKKEKIERENRPPEKSMLDKIGDVSEALLTSKMNTLNDKYSTLIQTLRTSLVMHNEGKLSADSVLFVLKAEMLKLDNKCLTITTEEQRRAQRVIDGYIKLCHENGFKAV